MQAYEQSKARMWRNNRATDVAVGCATDPVVMRNLATAAGRRCTFDGPTADYRLDGSTLVSPHGAIAERQAMTRDLPHDVSNALAAAAITIESGLATTAAVAEALATFEHPPHRIEPIGEFAGARWYNDSKATTPHAAITAISGFDRRRAARRRSQQGPRSGQSRGRARSGEGGRRSRRGGADHSRRVHGLVRGRRGSVDGRGSRRRGSLGVAGRHRSVVAGVRQLRLVSRRRLPGTWGRLQATRARPLRTGWHDELVDDRHRRSPQAGARSGRRAAPAPDAASVVEAAAAADCSVLRHRCRRCRVRDARSRDGAVGIVDQPVPPGPVAVSHLQQAGDLGGVGPASACGSRCACRTTSGAAWCCPR